MLIVPVAVPTTNASSLSKNVSIKNNLARVERGCLIRTWAYTSIQMILILAALFPLQQLHLKFYFRGQHPFAA
jgi:hypothetical protein